MGVGRESGGTESATFGSDLCSDPSINISFVLVGGNDLNVMYIKGSYNKRRGQEIEVKPDLHKSKTETNTELVINIWCPSYQFGWCCLTPKICSKRGVSAKSYSFPQVEYPLSLAITCR